MQARQHGRRGSPILSCEPKTKHMTERTPDDHHDHRRAVAPDRGPGQDAAAYEDMGLIYNVGRSPGNYRLFSEEALW